MGLSVILGLILIHIQTVILGLIQVFSLIQCLILILGLTLGLILGCILGLMLNLILGLILS